jgi:hypothetical protein
MHTIRIPSPDADGIQCGRPHRGTERELFSVAEEVHVA